MHQIAPRALFLFAATLCASLFVFVGSQVLTLSDMAARIHPLLGSLVFWGGSTAYLGALGWLAASWFLRPRPLVRPQNPTPEELRDYLHRLAARLRGNPHLREGDMAHGAPQPVTRAAAPSADTAAGMPPTAAEVATLLHALDAAALRETKRTASRIFLSTAVARNGRLDTLIVLALLARLVWRISSLYNQRPHPRDMVRLYTGVAGAALAAGVLEEAGLDEHISALLGPLLTASPLATVPGTAHVGALLAAALVDGSANALLALRVGIVTRNMLSPVLPGYPERQNPYRESAVLLGRMTAGLVRAVTRAVVGGVASGIRSGIEGTARRTADAVRKSARATVHGMGTAVQRAGDMATSMARNMPFRVEGGSEADGRDTDAATPRAPRRSQQDAAAPVRPDPPHRKPDHARTPTGLDRITGLQRLLRKKRR